MVILLLAWMIPAWVESTFALSYLQGSAPASYNVGPGGITIEAWVQMRSLPGYDPRIVIATSEPVGSHTDPMEVWQWYVCKCSSCPKGSLGFGLTHDRWSRHELASRTRIDDGTFHHFATTYDGQVMRIYVDGVLDTSKTVGSVTVNVGGGGMVVGQSIDYGNPMDGQVDELRVWDHARTAAEIAASYGSEISPFSPGLIGYWRLNDDGTDLAGTNSLTAGGGANYIPSGRLGSGNVCFSDVSTTCYISGIGGACAGLGPDVTPPSLQTTVPASGDSVYAGEAVAMTWQASDPSSPRSAKVDYSLDGGMSYIPIAGWFHDTGGASIVNPPVPPTGGLLRLRIRDAAGNESSATFPIRPERVPPWVQLSVPNGGEILAAGVSFPIHWSATDNQGVTSVDIEFSSDGGASYSAIALGAASTSPYSWNFPSDTTESGRIRITAWDAAGNAASDVSDANFSIRLDRVPPTVHLTTPNGGEVLAGDCITTVRWTTSDDVGVSRVDLEFSVDGGATFVPAGSTSGTTELAWQVPNVTTSTGVMRITAWDQTGKSSSDSSDQNFSINAISPVYYPWTGHYYEAVQGHTTWEEARIAAAKRVYKCVPGHLVTITTAGENSFVFGPSVPGNKMGMWLGGFQNHESRYYLEPRGGWQWVTREPFIYSLFAFGEPNNDSPNSDFLESMITWTAGSWNDEPANSEFNLGYIVEYDVPFPVVGGISGGGSPGIPGRLREMGAGPGQAAAEVDPRGCLSLAGGHPRASGRLPEFRLSMGAVPGTAKLTLLDAQGRHVANLFESHLQPGETITIPASGATAVGRRIAAGVYFLQFTAPGVDRSLKVMILQ
ncbi:MAG: hypothetical protein HZB25_07200 [Candidatus Eisenbacteria bacterium]|nr:hypothetical protein [Candidatus Eisenbacteria bacterium]